MKLYRINILEDLKQRANTQTSPLVKFMVAGLSFSDPIYKGYRLLKKNEKIKLCPSYRIP